MAITNVAVGTSATQIYSSTGETCVVSAFFCNYSGSTVTFSVYLGASASNSTLVLKDISLNASDTYIFNTERMVLANSEKILAVASSSSAITATISYSNI